MYPTQLSLFLLIPGVFGVTNHDMYKRVFLDGYEWTQFVYQTPEYLVQTRIECGGFCSSKGSGCDLFIHKPDQSQNASICYFGTFDNSYKSYLSSSGIGENSVYVKIERVNEVFDANYYELSYIEDESNWKSYFYAKKSIPHPGDFMDCSFICKSVERDNGCEMFYFEIEDYLCYLGKTSVTDGTVIANNLSNKTLFATMGAMNTITNPIAYKNDVLSTFWTNHVVESHSDAIQNLKQCETLTMFEDWHYSVYDSTNKICYFAIMNTENKMLVEDTTTRQISINYGQLNNFLGDTFVQRSSNIFHPFTYVYFTYPTSHEHCAMHCVFDSNNKCDFFFIYHVYCYLGNFNQVSSIGGPGTHVTTYIYYSSVSDMINKLFPTSIEVAQYKSFSKEKERLDVSSELECGAHAALADGNIDYWRYITESGKCLLGELNHNKAAGNVVDLVDIRINRANTWNDINSMYNEKFTLSSAIWTKYIFKSESLGTGQDQTECGVHCELSVDKCDFFLISGGKCHLGRYDYYGSGTVSSNDVPTTYHKSSIAEPYILHPKFIWFSETQDWAKWIYKYEGRPVGRKCSFECYHDNNCDYYVDVHGYCLYGRFSYTGGQIIHWTDNTYVYVQKGKSPPSSIITNNYYDAYGNKDKSASHYWNWKAGIYGHYSDISSEELCAWRCLVSWIERCMFYFWGNGHCQLGNYISSGNGYTGHIDSNTKYKVLNELNNNKIQSLMSSYLGSIYTHHGGSCTNAGFRRLNYNGQKLRITSGWNEECTCVLGICAGCTHWYRDYERCTWAIHAPGARQISIKVTEMDLSHGDRVQVYSGMSMGANYYLYFTYNHGGGHWYYDTEFLYVYWYADCCWYDVGFQAEIRRHG